MRTLKNIPPNHSLLTEKVLIDNIGKLEEIEITKYGLSDQCNCRILQVQIKTDDTVSKSLANYLSNSSILNLHSHKDDGLLISLFELRYKTVINEFQKIYSSNLPHYSKYINYDECRSGEIELMIFKRINSDNFEFEVVNNRICIFSKENENSIEKALYFKRNNIFWKIVGTGCSCSSFKPLMVEDLDENSLTTLFKILQNGINENEEYTGIVSGKYNA